MLWVSLCYRKPALRADTNEQQSVFSGAFSTVPSEQTNNLKLRNQPFIVNQFAVSTQAIHIESGTFSWDANGKPTLTE